MESLHRLLVGLLLSLFTMVILAFLYSDTYSVTVFTVISSITNKYSLLDITVSKMIKAASLSGLSPDSNDTADGFWKYTSSSVFAATVVTTIGEEWGEKTP